VTPRTFAHQASGGGQRADRGLVVEAAGTVRHRGRSRRSPAAPWFLTNGWLAGSLRVV